MNSIGLARRGFDWHAVSLQYLENLVMLFTKRSCKEVAALVVAREDRSLRLGELIELRAHMLICKACPEFEKQVLTIRSAMRQWRNYTDEINRK